MAAAAIIRFPPPPPTRNELSSEHRANLVRTSNKLRQVLGSTPHVLDLSSYIVPVVTEEMAAPPKTPTSSRNPFRMHGRSKSVPKADIDATRTRTKSPDSIASTSSRTSRSSTKSVRVKTDELAWRSRYPMQHPPLLQLSVPSRSRKPQLETIPGSPPFHQTTNPITIEPPSFSLPSAASVRRGKLRRVRKMLGDDVPADLVFPSSPEESDSEEDSPLVSTPTSTMSGEWLLCDVDKPLPNVYKPLPSEPVPEPVRPRSQSKRAAPVLRRNRLYKDTGKNNIPSRSAERLESIAESTKETPVETLTCVGVSASAGVDGRGKSRRFIQGEIAFDQIGTAWGGGIAW